MSVYTTARDWYASRTGGGYLTIDPISWEIGRKGSGLFVTVPAVFFFDVTVPRALRWLFDPHDPRYLKASALHDYLLLQGWDRPSAGAVFYAALKADAVPFLRRLAMWLGVSLFRLE